MTGEAEAVGQLMEAGLLGAALERGGTGRRGEDAHCRNCKAPLLGRYCHECGQRSEVHRSLLHLAEEYYHGQIRFDGKLWRTLPLLLLAPGILTRRYVQGQRVRYVSPIALFLFSVFLMFFTIATINPAKNLQQTLVMSDQERAAIKLDLEKAKQDLAQANQQIANPDPGASAGPKLAAAEQMVSLAEDANDKAEATDDGLDLVNGKWREMIKELADNQKVTLFGNQILTERARNSLRDPDLLLYKIKNVASGYSFLLVPMSLPFVWLAFFWKRNVFLFDHVIFLFHSLSFMALFATLWCLGLRFGYARWLAGWPLLLPPLHLYVHVLAAYRLGLFAALWRTAYLLISALIVISIYLTVILLLGLLN